MGQIVDMTLLVRRGIMSMVRAHVIVRGMVQGVYFRAHTRDEAIAHNVTGWVKNRKDGGVEALFEGNEEDVRKVIDWCHKGPAWARVTDVHVDWQGYTGEFKRFFISWKY
jgi:acylphosphatase